MKKNHFKSNKRLVNPAGHSLFTILSILAIMTLLTWSCKKTTPAEALISVRDTNGKAVSGATVVLKQDTVVNSTTGVKADIYEEKITNSEGQAFFSFKWEAVLNVEVTKGTQVETDYIRLQQSKTVEKEIILK